MSRHVRVWVAVVVVTAAASPAAFGQGDAPAAADARDSSGVAAMLGRLERAESVADPAARGKAVPAEFSDQAVLMVHQDADRAGGVRLTTGKQQIVDTWSAKASKPALPKTTLATAIATVPAGPEPLLAEMTLSSRVRGGAPSGTVQRQFAMAHYDASRWKIYLSFPCFVTPVVRVDGVIRASQAGRLGVKPGQIIVSYAGRPVRRAGDVVRLVTENAKATPEKTIPLVVRTGGVYRTIHCRPGQLGVSMSTRLIGDEGTTTLIGDRAAAHPAGKVIGAAFARPDVKSTMDAMCSGGFILGVDPNWPDNASTLIHAGNIKAWVGGHIERVGRQLKMDTIRCEDMRVIVRGDVALAGTVMTARTVEGKPVSIPTVSAMVKYKGKWGMVTAGLGGNNTMLGHTRPVAKKWPEGWISE